MSALRLAALSFGLTLPVWSALSGCSQSDPAGSGPPSKAGAGGQSSAGAANSGGGSSGATPGGAAGAPSGGAGRANGGSSPAGGAGNGGAGGRLDTAGTAGIAGSIGGGSSGGGGAGGSSPSACPVISDFANWTSGKGPLDVGKLAVPDFKAHTNDAYDYPVVLTWSSALRFTASTADSANNTALSSAWGSSKVKSSPPPNPTGKGSVDERVFGVLPLELYLQNHEQNLKDLGLSRADTQWLPPLNQDMITTDARYWSDDMFMITELQVMAYRATKKSDYLDHASTALLIYVKKLRQNSLFWHTLDSKPAWGRANGWFATGMSELLLELPAGQTRDSVLAAYKTHMDGILPLQVSGGDDDGCWRQVLDLASAPIETSCTAMFTTALATGLKNGWLTEPKYAAAARKGWQCVANKTNSAGKLDRTCPGTGAATTGDSLAKQQQFYVERMSQVQLGDLHGQLALLGAANALVRTDCPGVR